MNIRPVRDRKGSSSKRVNFVIRRMLVGIGVLLVVLQGFEGLLSAQKLPSRASGRVGTINTPEDFDRLLGMLGSPERTDQEEAAAALDQMGDLAVPALIQLGLWNPDHLLRQNAVNALARRGPSARGPLIKALKDKEPRVRSGAAAALGAMADPLAIPSLVRVLGDKVPSVRQDAFSALAAMGPRTTSALINGLADSNADIRRNTAVLLQKVGRPALPALLRTLAHKNPQMRSAAAMILGRIGDPDAIPSLIQMLGEPDEIVRANVLSALVQSFKEKAVDPLMTVLRGPNTLAHDPALFALADIGQPAIPALARFIQEPTRPYPLRARAGRILRQQKWIPHKITERIWGHIVTGEWDQIPQTLQALPPLMTTMGDPLEEVRMAASGALVPFGAKAVTPLATEILRHRDPLFLESAAKTLGQIKIRDFLAVEALTGLLQNPAHPVQSAAIQTLGKIGNFNAVAPLLGVVEDPKRLLNLRIMAVEALENLGDPRVTPRLVVVLERTKNLDFNKALIYTLGQLRNAEAAPILIRRMGDESPMLRKVAGEAIIKLRPLPIDALINQLADSRPIVQSDTAVLLSKIGEPAVGQLIATLKKRDAPPGIKAQAEQLLIKVLKALPGNVDVLIKALDAPSDRVRLLAIQSLSEIKTIRAAPSLLDIAEQEWRYPPHLREQAKIALQKIHGHAGAEKWEALLAQRRHAHFERLARMGQIGLMALYALISYWITLSLIGILFWKISRRVPYRTYRQHLSEIIHQQGPAVSRPAVQRGLRLGFAVAWVGMFMGLLLTGGGIALLVWSRVVDSVVATFSVWGALFGLLLFLQSSFGAERVSRLLDHRQKATGLFWAPITYLGRLLFPMVTDLPAYEEIREIISEEPLPPLPPSAPEEEPLTSFAMLLSDFPRAERIDILQALGEHAARFPPTDPQEVLNVVFKEAYARIRSHAGSNRKEDVRAFLATLVPMAMALSEPVEEIQVNLDKMLALVGSSNSLVKLEQFFSDVLSGVEHTVLKGAFPMILELLQAGFFPITELIEEAKDAKDRPLLYYSWREIVSTKIQKDQFNISDATHIALHYTSFRQRAHQNRLLNLVGYTPHYTDYKKIVDQWKKGSQKNAARVKQLREISDQFGQLIQNIDKQDRVIASPWLTRRLTETFGADGHPANWLFVVSKSGVGVAPSFLALDPKIPQISDAPPEPASLQDSVDAFDALMSQ